MPPWSFGRAVQTCLCPGERPEATPFPFSTSLAGALPRKGLELLCCCCRRPARSHRRAGVRRRGRVERRTFLVLPRPWPWSAKRGLPRQSQYRWWLYHHSLTPANGDSSNEPQATNQVLPDLKKPSYCDLRLWFRSSAVGICTSRFKAALLCVAADLLSDYLRERAGAQSRAGFYA